jgi:hypothetical protein
MRGRTSRNVLQMIILVCYAGMPLRGHDRGFFSNNLYSVSVRVMAGHHEFVELATAKCSTYSRIFLNAYFVRKLSETVYKRSQKLNLYISRSRAGIHSAGVYC